MSTLLGLRGVGEEPRGVEGDTWLPRGVEGDEERRGEEGVPYGWRAPGVPSAFV